MQLLLFFAVACAAALLGYVQGWTVGFEARGQVIDDVRQQERLRQIALKHDLGGAHD